MYTINVGDPLLHNRLIRNHDSANIYVEMEYVQSGSPLTRQSNITDPTPLFRPNEIFLSQFEHTFFKGTQVTGHFSKWPKRIFTRMSEKTF